MRVLLLASTPLHGFLCLGLMLGPLRDEECTLALIDQPPGARDYVAEALEAAAPHHVRVVRLPSLRPPAAARQAARAITEFAERLAPARIVVGNDERVELYAALRGCPSVRCTYLDDGLSSYILRRPAKAPWREKFATWRRGLRHGLPLEWPAWVGGSRAVGDAIVMLPAQVHAALAGKPLERLRPEWFREPSVRRICAAAAALAGLDAERCASIGLLLLLPRTHWLERQPALARSLRELASAALARGEVVAVKSHPRVADVPVHVQLGLPVRDGLLEVPARLPIEVLTPLLRGGTQVVGASTTALLTLALLGQELRVHSLSPEAATRHDGLPYADRAAEVYAAAGIRPLGQ